MAALICSCVKDVDVCGAGDGLVVGAVGGTDVDTAVEDGEAWLLEDVGVKGALEGFFVELGVWFRVGRLWKGELDDSGCGAEMVVEGAVGFREMELGEGILLAAAEVDFKKDW